MIERLRLPVLLSLLSLLVALQQARAATAPALRADPVLAIVYDDRSTRRDVRPGSGFACVVSGAGGTVLFDTGGSGEILLHNLDALGVEPARLNAVVVSHLHSDHAGGLKALLRRAPGLAVHLPAPSRELVPDLGASRHWSVAQPGRAALIVPGVFSTGALGTSPPEQALAIRSSRGLVVVTGCAHPGVARVVRHAREVMKEDVLLVVGGFHLRGRSRREIEAAIAGLKKLGVRYVAPCHCTGEEARELFRKRFGAGFIEAGAGTVITIPPP